MTSMALKRVDRDRHGRGVRRPTQTRVIKHGMRGSYFNQVVDATCDWLQHSWPEELQDLNWSVRDMPMISKDALSVKRYAIREQTQSIIFYRIPIQRMQRSTGIKDERTRIEQIVLDAVSELIDKDPWELLDPNRP